MTDAEMGPLLSLLYALTNVLAFPWLAWRVISSRGWAGLRSRFGADLGEPLAESIWLHGASVGEVGLLAPLIERFERDHPGITILISTSSPTGLTAARNAHPDHRIIEFPFDFRFVARRYFRHFNPIFVVIVESEFWPGFLAELQVAGIPVAVVNGKMSARSYDMHRRTRFVAHALRGIDLIAAQTDEHAARMLGLGVEKSRVVVTGNMKYDLTDSRAREEAGRRRVALGYADTATVIIGGSLHDDEHEIVLDAFSEVRRHVGESALILVPRYPAHAEAVLGAARRRGLEGVRLEDVEAGRSEAPGASRVLIVDTVGQLRALYAVADIAFVGGSLRFRGTNRGGHNLMEPAVLGVPVVFGPHHFSFRDTAEKLVTAGGGKEARDAAELARVLTELAANADARRRMGERARRVVLDARGATERNYALIADLMRRGSGVLAAQGH